MKSKTYSVFFHNYYGKDQEWFSFFADQSTVPFHLYYNCVRDSYYRLAAIAEPPGIFSGESFSKRLRLSVRNSTNLGKDIGGKLVLMDAYLRLNAKTDYILLLHDKQSPYHHNSDHWRKELLRIAGNEFQQQVFRLFDENPQTGIVASKSTILNELNNDQDSNAYINSVFINSLKQKYNLSPPDLQYVAGTMFWVRASIFEEFFNRFRPLDVRQLLEKGNITDEAGPTNTHAWERILCWIVSSGGYKIKGI